MKKISLMLFLMTKLYAQSQNTNTFTLKRQIDESYGLGTTLLITSDLYSKDLLEAKTGSYILRGRDGEFDSEKYRTYLCIKIDNSLNYVAVIQPLMKKKTSLDSQYCQIPL